MKTPWYMAWWALDFDMWDNDDFDDERPTERRVFNHIQKQAQFALILRYALTCEERQAA